MIISILKEVLEHKNVTAGPNINTLYAYARSVAQLCQLFAALQTVAHQAPLSMGFSRQEDWSGLPCPPPGSPPGPGVKPTSPTLAGKFFTTCATWEAQTHYSQP